MTVENRKIHAVYDMRFMPSNHWQVSMKLPDGNVWGHCFQPNIFDIRAAEYAIDPFDTETLLGIVLHEAHIPDPIHPENHATDVAMVAGHSVMAKAGRDHAPAGQLVPAWLYNAESIDQARKALFLRLDHVRKNLVNVVTAPGDAVDVIRNSHKPDLAYISAFQDHVAEVRNRLTINPVIKSQAEKFPFVRL